MHYFYFVCHIKFMYDSAHGTLNVRSYFKYHFNNRATGPRAVQNNVQILCMRSLCFLVIHIMWSPLRKTIIPIMCFITGILVFRRHSRNSTKLIALFQNFYSFNIRVEITVQAAAMRRLRIIINGTIINYTLPIKCKSAST